jgi:hypothetical protein
MKLANPSIVIGLGGTGQWVLTYLKKNLIDTYGKVPPTVELLAFDTTSPMVGSEKKAGSGLENFPQVGSVQLDNEEFVYLGGNIRRICEEIRDEGKHNHIGSWFQAKQYLAAFDDDAYEISKGAGQRRPFGRMAVFYDLATDSPKIIGKLTQAINDVMTANQRQQPIEFYIVTSVVGGTGSGMFIDMAHIARKMAERAGVAFAIRGFIVLPNTFDPVIKVSNIEPNAFAAMRELDRFMLVFDRDYPIYYSEDQREPLSVYHSIYRSKLFDSCYFIDAHRPNFPLTEAPPTKGVFPAIAESITVLLDPSAGDTFFQHFKNISNEVSRAQTETGKAIYSSLGAYTYILPVEDIIERNTYKAAIQLLRDYLLNIERDSRDSQLRVSSKGNTETDLKPFEEVLRFLKMGRTHTGLQNLVFSQQVSRFLESGRMKEQDLINEVSHIGREILNWISPPVQNRLVLKASNQILKNLETSLIDEVPNSREYGGNPQEAAERIKNQILQIRECVLGREDAQGNRTPGELQEGLLQYKEQNIIRFRTLLIEEIENILNGIVDDPLRGKVGKLPYARDFTDRLVQSFDEFIAVMQKVVQERVDRISLAREDVLATKRMMDDTRHLTGLLARLKGTAVDAENQYIAAENYLLELERQEILYQSVLSTARALKSVASEARTQCNRWINLLVFGVPIGNDKHSREIGVYTKLLNEQEELQRRRKEQAKIRVYEYLSDPEYEDELYYRLIGEEWPSILRRFSWSLEEVEGELHLYVKYANEDLVIERNSQETATDINTRLLLEKLRHYFYDVRNETISERMEHLFTAQQAAKNLLDNSEPMINYAAHEQKMNEKRNFVCINLGVQVRYVNDLAASLRQSTPSDRENQVIGLTNRHRCIVLSTADLLTGKYTAPYRSAKNSYKEYRGNRKMLHTFPAEVNASEFEQRLPHPPLFQNTRMFSPHVVSLLENPSMVRRFVLGLFYSLIQVEEVGSANGLRQYVLRLDRQNRRDPTAFLRLTKPAIKPRLLDAMNNFVYPKVKAESEKPEIWDVMPGSAIWVKPDRVDKAIEVREQSILSGREVVVDAFEVALKDISDVLTAGGQEILPNAFRLFLANNEYILQLSEEDLQAEEKGENGSLTKSLNQFLGRNDDCYISKHKARVREVILSVLNQHRGSQRVRPVDQHVLAQQLENYINERPEVSNLNRGVIARLESSDDVVDRDLGAIIHLVLWDEINCLGGLPHRVNLDHPLHMMAQRFLRQSGCEINLVRDEAYLCDVSNTNFCHLLQEEHIYAYVLPSRPLDHLSVLRVYRKTQQLDSDISKVFVFTDRHPTDKGWAQIGTLRMDSFVILPLDHSLIKKGLTKGKSREVLRSEVEERLGADYDPYDVKNPVASAFSFFGRDKLIERILRHIDAIQHIGIFGLRKLGKTSILHVIQDRVSFPTALIDLQSVGENTQLKPLYDRIVDHWHQWIRVHHEKELESPSLGITDPTGSFVEATRELLNYLDKSSNKAQLVLLLDEVESIVPGPDASGWKTRRYLDFMQAVRGLANEDGRLSLIVASLNPSISHINSFLGGQQNPIYSLLKEIYLPPLANEACAQMVRNIGRQVGLVYGDQSIELVIQMSGGHPFLARQLCSLLYRQRDQRPGEVGPDEISLAVDHFIYDMQTVRYLEEGIWKDAGNISLWGEKQAKVNQEILLELARADEPLTKDALLEATGADIRRASLISLERFHFVHQPDPGHYALRYGLLRIWLRRRKLGLEGS